MAVDLNELLIGVSAKGLERMAAGFDQDARLLNNVAISKFQKVDLTEAAAAKELAKSGIATDIAGLNTGHGTPNPATQPK